MALFDFGFSVIRCACSEMNEILSYLPRNHINMRSLILLLLVFVVAYILTSAFIYYAAVVTKCWCMMLIYYQVNTFQ